MTELVRYNPSPTRIAACAKHRAYRRVSPEGTPEAFIQREILPYRHLDDFVDEQQEPACDRCIVEGLRAGTVEISNPDELREARPRVPDAGQVELDSDGRFYGFVLVSSRPGPGGRRREIRRGGYLRRIDAEHELELARKEDAKHAPEVDADEATRLAAVIEALDQWGSEPLGLLERALDAAERHGRLDRIAGRLLAAIRGEYATPDAASEVSGCRP